MRDSLFAAGLVLILVWVLVVLAPPVTRWWSSRHRRTHRELLCQVCDREYQVWSAPNPIWNAAIRQSGTDEWAFLCPTCFTNIAAERGAHTGHWMVTDESSGYEVAAQLAYWMGEIARQAEDAHEIYRLGPKAPA